MLTKNLPRDIRSVLIVDDHPLYAEALTLTLTAQLSPLDVRTVGSIGDALAAILAAPEAFDLVILDFGLPDSHGEEGFHRLSRHVDPATILVVSGAADGHAVARLLAQGAAGFMPKSASADTLHTVIDQIRHGLPYRSVIAPSASGIQSESAARRLSRLTPQQARILSMIHAGKQNKQIAFEMDLAEATIKAHITALLRRLEVGNRTQAALLAEAAQGGTGSAMAAE